MEFVGGAELMYWYDSKSKSEDYHDDMNRRNRNNLICGGQNGAGAGFLRVFRFPLPIFVSRDSVVGIATGYGLDD
jgi:hypothetical protein